MIKNQNYLNKLKKRKKKKIEKKSQLMQIVFQNKEKDNIKKEIMLVL